MAASPPKPPPFASHPSAAELIDSYLRPRVVSGTKVAAFIHEADLYASGPDDLTGRFAPATAGDGQQAWYFFTRLKLQGGPRDRVSRAVDTREGSWVQKEAPLPVAPNLGDPAQAQIGRSQAFAFATKDQSGKLHQVGWRMVEFRLDPDHGDDRDRGSQDAVSGPIVLCKVYRSRLQQPKAKPDDESPVAAMAGAPPGRKEVGDEASAAAGVAGPGREEDEETGSDLTVAAARIGIKRKAGDLQDSGEETAAASLERQKSAGAAATGELCDDRRASRDAADEEEVEVPAETEEPRDPSKPQFYDFLANWDK
ncbi:hypothetical protein HU200_036881 [Digitaria exilis]|uniref:NAC domain-containing protein n=1 Tax=Digitaria exilis TaxID=1010633 RepID=A0A835BKL9_9POAL|nr:hypothetical protein HU200_036881 [Digitaria exilis]